MSLLYSSFSQPCLGPSHLLLSQCFLTSSSGSLSFIFSFLLCISFFGSSWQVPVLCFPHTVFCFSHSLLTFPGGRKSSIFLAEALLPCSGSDCYSCHRAFASVHSTSALFSGCFVVQMKYYHAVFMSLTSIFIKFSLHLCSVLWITLSCLFCAELQICPFVLISTLFKCCLFYKCRARSDLSFLYSSFSVRIPSLFCLHFILRCTLPSFCSMESALNFSLRKNWTDLLSPLVSSQCSFYNPLTDIFFITSD